MESDKFAQAQVIVAYKNLFLRAQNGPEVLRDLCADNFIDQSTFDENPIVMARNEGRRLAILDILGKLNTDVVQLLSENITMEDF